MLAATPSSPRGVNLHGHWGRRLGLFLDCGFVLGGPFGTDPCARKPGRLLRRRAAPPAATRGRLSPGWSSALPGARGAPPGAEPPRQKGPSPPRRLLGPGHVLPPLSLRLPIQRCPRVSPSHPSFVLSGCLLSPTAPAHTDKSPDSSTSASRKEAQALRIAGRLPPGHCTPCGEEKEEHLLWAEGV